jgi:HNH endonuclease
MAGLHKRMGRSDILGHFRPSRMTRDLAALLHRFQGNLVPHSEGCWGWRAHTNSAGYGMFQVAGVGKVLVHRLAWELVHGPIPQGRELDHLCRNRACPNPVHLELVTARENILRGEGTAARHARQTVCQNGHPFTYVSPRGQRYCRRCANAKRRVRRAARRVKGDCQYGSSA